VIQKLSIVGDWQLHISKKCLDVSVISWYRVKTSYQNPCYFDPQLKSFTPQEGQLTRTAKYNSYENGHRLKLKKRIGLTDENPFSSIAWTDRQR
jgi:hypothetical protein